MEQVSFIRFSGAKRHGKRTILKEILQIFRTSTIISFIILSVALHETILYGVFSVAGFPFSIKSKEPKSKREHFLY